MFKYLLIFLIVVLSNLTYPLASGSKDVDNSKYISEVPVEAPYEYIDGVNVVDSVRNYYCSGALHHQWVYYSDGSEAIFNSYLDVQDLYLRVKYIEYKNEYGDITYAAMKPFFSLADMVDANSLSYNEKVDWLLFNDYLASIKVEAINSKEYEHIILNREYEVPTILCIIAILALIYFITTKVIFYPKRRKKGSEKNGFSPFNSD